MHTSQCCRGNAVARKEKEVSTETLESTHAKPSPRRASAGGRVWRFTACGPHALELSSSSGGGQATKGAWWMPRHQEAMKDVVNCEMPRGAVSRRRSVDVRMGKPGGRNGPSSNGEYIAIRSQPGEVKHLSTRRKRNQPRLR